ncbi:DUF1295 domain-containing protein [Bacillus cereus]
MYIAISFKIRKADTIKRKNGLISYGLFKYAIHFNYLGDCIWVLGLALISCNICIVYLSR